MTTTSVELETFIEEVEFTWLVIEQATLIVRRHDAPSSLVGEFASRACGEQTPHCGLFEDALHYPSLYFSHEYHSGSTMNPIFDAYQRFLLGSKQL